MARVSAQDCLQKVPNHFALCILAARRARELAVGRRPLVRCDNKAAVTSLREIAAGHVSFNESVEDAIRMHIADRNVVEGGRAVGPGQRRVRKAGE
jgi:DNA-directed RNA polymerase subunit omega